LKTHFFQDEGVIKAVDGASFDIYAGKTLGIVGESGCGKSVTARAILRLVQKPGRIVDGQILYRSQTESGQASELDLAQIDPTGAEIRKIRGSEVALIFQEPMSSFSPVHTIGSQIVEALLLHTDLSRKDALDRTIELLREVGIPLPEKRVNEYPHQLSGGLRQRAMIAMALSCSPRLLIADEPTTAIDVTTQAQILQLLKRLQADTDMAIMFITHDLGVIAEIADEVIVMYLGQVVEHAPVDALFHNPKHPYTRALLRSIPTVHATPRGELPTIVGSVPHPYNRPAGCPFHPRCGSFMPGECDQQEPPLLSIDENRSASCLLYSEQSEDDTWITRAQPFDSDVQTP
jgi:peptide/nickel transport system ATP-binding protein